MILRIQRLLRPLMVAVLLLGGFVLTQQPQPSSAQLDSRYFADTGYRLDNESFWDIYDANGRQAGLGLPVSRTFRLLGRPTQIFQRGMIQQAFDGTPFITGVLQDEQLFPYHSINGSIFPTYDINLVATAPLAGSE